MVGRGEFDRSILSKSFRFGAGLRLVEEMELLPEPIELFLGDFDPIPSGMTLDRLDFLESIRSRPPGGGDTFFPDFFLIFLDGIRLKSSSAASLEPCRFFDSIALY